MIGRVNKKQRPARLWSGAGTIHNGGATMQFRSFNRVLTWRIYFTNNSEHVNLTMRYGFQDIYQLGPHKAVAEVSKIGNL